MPPTAERPDGLRGRRRPAGARSSTSSCCPPAADAARSRMPHVRVDPASAQGVCERGARALIEPLDIIDGDGRRPRRQRCREGHRPAPASETLVGRRLARFEDAASAQRARRADRRKSAIDSCAARAGGGRRASRVPAPHLAAVGRRRGRAHPPPQGVGDAGAPRRQSSRSPGSPSEHLRESRTPGMGEGADGRGARLDGRRPQRSSADPIPSSRIQPADRTRAT